MEYGSNVIITCGVFGAPSPNITIIPPDNGFDERSQPDFFYNHTVSDDVTNINTFVILSHVIHLNNVTDCNSGNYSCIADNGIAESAFATFKLVVQGNVHLMLVQELLFL